MFLSQRAIRYQSVNQAAQDDRKANKLPPNLGFARWKQLYLSGGIIHDMKERLDKQGLEAENQVIDQIGRLLKRFDDRLTLNNVRLPERYFKNDLHILMHIRSVNFDAISRQSRQVSSEFVACFERTPSLMRTEVQVKGVNLGISRNAAQPLMIEHSLDNHSLQVSREHNDTDCGPDSYQNSMLVDIVESVESPEGVIPSLVWLAGLDCLYRCLRHSLYFSGRFGFVFRGIIADREISRLENLRVCRAVDHRKVVSEMIQSRPEIEQHISRYAADAQRDIVGLHEIVNTCLRNIVVRLDANHIGIRIKEGFDFRFEIADVLFGPFDFRPNQSEPFICCHQVLSSDPNPSAQHGRNSSCDKSENPNKKREK